MVVWWCGGGVVVVWWWFWCGGGGCGVGGVRSGLVCPLSCCVPRPGLGLLSVRSAQNMGWVITRLKR
eukprot:3160733-Prymnesium_polylepis.1